MIHKTKFKDLVIIQNKKYKDSRGFLIEVLKNKELKKKFLFMFCSYSKKDVIRGLHIQTQKLQGKYISVLKGKILDVVLDLRKNSKTYGEYYGVTLSDKNSTSLFIPVGFAHGFCSLGNESLVLYGMTNYRSKKNEVGILWNDKIIKIKWPVKKPLVSSREKKNITLKQFNNLYLNKL